jgi:hypothetical protein
MAPQRFLSTQEEANEQQRHGLTRMDPEGYIYENKWLI